MWVQTIAEGFVVSAITIPVAIGDIEHLEVFVDKGDNLGIGIGIGLRGINRLRRGNEVIGNFHRGCLSALWVGPAALVGEGTGQGSGQSVGLEGRLVVRAGTD